MVTETESREVAFERRPCGTPAGFVEGCTEYGTTVEGEIRFPLLRGRTMRNAFGGQFRDSTIQRTKRYSSLRACLSDRYAFRKSVERELAVMGARVESTFANPEAKSWDVSSRIIHECRCR